MATRKTLEFRVIVEFEGDYYDFDDCISLSEAWMDAALDDRSDLRYIDITLERGWEEDL